MRNSHDREHDTLLYVRDELRQQRQVREVPLLHRFRCGGSFAELNATRRSNDFSRKKWQRYIECRCYCRTHVIGRAPVATLHEVDVLARHTDIVGELLNRGLTKLACN